ncbi:PorT family protein [Flavihumibacter rivuli]|uniref:porin family protein n=1 Tax=Flavihumibacter rivuli TaxID=2838156 RepID=UPI001BDE2C18|nr:porin family protein [Flavihumibacter rivuli]ULQ57916.1 PorT family protein [Flavihumibacter rivuli]
MKKITLFAIGVFGLLTANAQVGFGVKAGYNLADFKGRTGDNPGMKSGFHAGGFVRIPVSGKFSIQPELLYSQQGVNDEVQVNEVTYQQKLKTNYLTLPVLFQYQSPLGINVSTGPQLGYLLSSKLEANKGSMDYKDFLKSTDISWVLGAGYEMRNGLGIGARYCWGLNNVSDSYNDLRSRVLQVGLSYKFGSGKK